MCHDVTRGGMGSRHGRVQTRYIFNVVPFHGVTTEVTFMLFFMRLKIFFSAQAFVLHLVICLLDIDMCRVYVVTHVADILGTIIRICYVMIAYGVFA